MFIDTIATKRDIGNSALTETRAQIFWPIPKKNTVKLISVRQTPFANPNISYVN